MGSLIVVLVLGGGGVSGRCVDIPWMACVVWILPRSACPKRLLTLLLPPLRSRVCAELPADVNGDGFFDVLTLVETFNGKTFVAEIYYGPDLSEDEADMTRIVFEPPTGDVYSPDFLTAGHVMGPPGAAASDVVVTLIDRLHFRPTLFVFAGPMIQGETYFIANASARIDPPTTHICEFNHITLCDFNGDGAEDVVLATTQEYYTNSSEQVGVCFVWLCGCVVVVCGCVRREGCACCAQYC